MLVPGLDKNLTSITQEREEEEEGGLLPSLPNKNPPSSLSLALVFFFFLRCHTWRVALCQKKFHRLNLFQKNGEGKRERKRAGGGGTEEEEEEEDRHCVCAHGVIATRKS